MSQLTEDLQKVIDVLEAGWCTGMFQDKDNPDKHCLEGAVQIAAEVPIGVYMGVPKPAGVSPDDRWGYMGDRYYNLYTALRDQMRLRNDSFSERRPDHQWNSLWAWNDEQKDVEPVLEVARAALEVTTKAD